MMKIVIGDMLVGLLVLLSSIQVAEAEIDRLTLRVDGLACPFCAYGLEKKLTKIGSISSYDVDFKEGKVFLGLKTDTQIELKSFYKAVREAGFTLKSISLRAKGKIGQSEQGLILLVKESKDTFLLFESKGISRKYHKGEISKPLNNKLEKRLIQLKDQGKEVLIEGVVHEHNGLPPGLSVDSLEVVE